MNTEQLSFVIYSVALRLESSKRIKRPKEVTSEKKSDQSFVFQVSIIFHFFPNK